MPKIDIRKTIELTLPSYEGSKVVIYDKVLAGTMEKMMDCKNDFERGLVALQDLIKEWNFVDDEGNKLEINLENLRKLPMKDLTFLIEKVGDFFIQAEKEGKKSSKE